MCLAGNGRCPSIRVPYWHALRRSGTRSLFAISRFLGPRFSCCTLQFDGLCRLAFPLPLSASADRCLSGFGPVASSATMLFAVVLCSSPAAVRVHFHLGSLWRKQIKSDRKLQNSLKIKEPNWHPVKQPWSATSSYLGGQFLTTEARGQGPRRSGASRGPNEPWK